MLRGERVKLRAVGRGHLPRLLMRGHVWLDGRYLDNVLMGILRDEWRR